MHRRWPALLALTAALGVAHLGFAAGASAQISLHDALSAADDAAFPNRIAAGNLAARRGESLAPLRGMLPTLRLDAGYLRTTDPLNTFGLALQQRGITAADFDPQRLNFPGAIGNYSAGIVVEQPLFNADAWLGRRAASHAVDATTAQQSWTRISTHTDVIRAYYGAVLAAERVATLEAAARAAHSHVTQAQSMVRNGLVTKSDALLAEVRAGEVDAQLVEARGNAESAGRQLEVALGQDPAGDLALPRSLPASARIVDVVAADTAARPQASRADIEAARRGLDAARADALRARSTYLPRVNGFARYDWNSASRPYAGDRSWTVGVMASWDLFAGASTLSDVRATAGRESTARAQADAASAKARLEAQQSRTALEVALARLAIAERAVAQSTEAHRIVAKQYEGGLATIAALLDAQAADVSSSLALSQARYAAIVAGAERKQTLGLDPASIAALDDFPTGTASSDPTANERDGRPGHDAPPR
ncbi:MAG TPA: TolC family protein [Gemmatimonadaceae bacterium]|nr:TolC family protein [Gemmatimonadaceae bacterium]